MPKEGLKSRGGKVKRKAIIIDNKANAKEIGRKMA
jgi:hypothetical protein